MRHNHKQLCAVLAAALFAALAAPAFAQQPEIDSVASDLSKSLSTKHGHELNKTRVVVIPFTRFHGYVNELGIALADELAQALSKQGKNLEVVDIEELKALMKREALIVEQLSDAQIARWLAEKSGAYLAIFGFLEVPGKFISLRVRVERVSDGRVMATSYTRIPITSDLEALYSTTVKGFPTAADLSVRKAPLPTGVLRAGENGVSNPECVHCSDPHYSQAARDAKFGGTLLLRMIVNPDGSTSNISVLRGLPFDLNEQGIKAVSGWRFRPGKDRDGKPVPVEMVIEMTFRLL
jgi:TonB family protein